MSLDVLLQDKNFKKTSNLQTLLGIARDISAGMLQLEEKGIFHCDLRAQNVLVNQRGNSTVCKLNDFGLSKNTYDPTQLESTTLPIKWTDVQVLNGKGMTSKSDVFSFAIVCFEIFTFGETPYKGMSNLQAARFVIEGNRMTLPGNVPDMIKELIDRCWSENASHRPTFGEIVTIIDHFIIKDSKRELKSKQAQSGNLRNSERGSAVVYNSASELVQLTPHVYSQQIELKGMPANAKKSDADKAVYQNDH